MELTQAIDKIVHNIYRKTPNLYYYLNKGNTQYMPHSQGLLNLFIHKYERLQSIQLPSLLFRE